MSGSNPYIEEVKYKKATKKFKVTFLPSGKTVEVDPERFPYRPQRPARQHLGYFRRLPDGSGPCLRRGVCAPSLHLPLWS